MDAGGADGSGSGGAGEACVASARSARHAVLLAIQAVGANDVAVREARAESDVVRAEIEWTKNGCSPPIGYIAGAAVDAIDNAAVSSGSGAGGLRSASAERSRRALLLVTEVFGVSAVAVREARAELVALKEELDLSLTSVEPLKGETLVPGPLDANNLLQRAAWAGAEYSLQLLLEAGAETDTADQNCYDALHGAAWKGHVNCLRLLLGAGADVDKAGVNGWTPLHIAAMHGYRECAQLLLEAGADAFARNKYGQTPLDIAENHSNKVTAALLRHAAASRAP